MTAENEFSIEDYIAEDEIPDYKMNSNNTSPDEEIRERPLISDVSYQDYLLNQLGLIKHTDKQHIIATTIIGNIDESGYLQRDPVALTDDLAFNQNLESTLEEILEVLKMIQGFDPAGIGARPRAHGIYRNALFCNWSENLMVHRMLNLH